MCFEEYTDSNTRLDFDLRTSRHVHLKMLFVFAYIHQKGRIIETENRAEEMKGITLSKRDT